VITLSDVALLDTSFTLWMGKDLYQKGYRKDEKASNTYKSLKWIYYIEDFSVNMNGNEIKTI
jgi:hypothetical protein